MRIFRRATDARSGCSSPRLSTDPLVGEDDVAQGEKHLCDIEVLEVARYVVWTPLFEEVAAHRQEQTTASLTQAKHVQVLFVIVRFTELAVAKMTG